MSSPLRAWDSLLRSIVAQIDLWIGRLGELHFAGTGHPSDDYFVAWTDLTVGLGLTRRAEPDPGDYSVLGRLGRHAAALLIQLWTDLGPPPELARAPV